MKYTNTEKLPQSVFDAIVANTYDLSKIGDVVSVTALLKAPRVLIMERRHYEELEEDISENIWRLLGSAVHSVIERSVDNGKRISERRLSLNIRGLEVSGKSDSFELEDGYLEDFKITSVWSIIFGDHGWEDQLNCYAYLWKKNGFAVNGLRVIAILKDWRKNEFRKDTNGNYPSIPIVCKDIPLRSEDRQQEFLLNRVDKYLRTKDLPDDKLPPCTPEERWTTDTKWAIYKPNTKTAKKVCNTKEEINFWINSNPAPWAWEIQERIGTDKKCVEYCSVNKYCDYYKQKYGGGK